MAEIAPGLVRETLDHGIIMYRIQALRKEILPAWDTDILTVTQAHSSDQIPLLLLYDLTAPGAAPMFMLLKNFNLRNPLLLPAGQNQFEQYLLSRPQLEVNVALVFRDQFSGRVLHTAVPGNQTGSLTLKTFRSRESALEWLQTRR